MAWLVPAGSPALKVRPMTITNRFLITVCVLFSLNASVLAQTTVTEPRTARVDKMHERLLERHRQHLSMLKTKLNLQAGQDALWDAYVHSMKPPAKSMLQPDRATLDKLTTPERVDRMQAFMTERDALMRQHGEATKAFYASLTADQQKVFDTETTRFMNARMHQAQPLGMHPGMYPAHGWMH